MARVTVENGELRVELEGMHKIWALRNRITVPLVHVRGATADANIVDESKGLRAPGTHIPASLRQAPSTRMARRSFGTSAMLQRLWSSNCGMSPSRDSYWRWRIRRSQLT